jgi:hypothetical protein
MRIPATIIVCAATLAADIPCATAKEAKAIAEVETLGEAVAARPVRLGDGSLGWEVVVHMPGRKKGWRCCIARNNGQLRWKAEIDNPASKRR